MWARNVRGVKMQSYDNVYKRLEFISGAGWKVTAKAFDKRADWLEDRRTSIGASEYPAIMGFSPWSNAAKVWDSKKYEVKDERGNADMERGNRSENAILDLWLAERNLDGVSGTGLIFRRNDFELVHASLDGVCIEKGRYIPIEIKSVSPFGQKAWRDAQGFDVPYHYKLQVAVQLFVTGAEYAYLIARFARGNNGGFGSDYEFVLTRESLAFEISCIRSSAEKFMASVKNNVRPACVISDEEFII